MTDVALRRRGDRAVFGAVFLMLFVFSYSEQIVSAVFPAILGSRKAAWQIAVVVVDAVVLGVAGLMKRVVTAGDDDTSRLWGWWWAGVAVLLAIDVIRLWSMYSIPLDMLTATLYAMAMGWTMAATLNADPLTLVRTERRISAPRDWRRVRAIVPLVVGAWLCYLAASAFVDHFDLASVRTLSESTAAEIADLPVAERLSVLSELCHGAISPVFFQQLVGGSATLVVDSRCRVQLLPQELHRRGAAGRDRRYRHSAGGRIGRSTFDTAVGWTGMR